MYMCEWGVSQEVQIMLDTCTASGVNTGVLYICFKQLSCNFSIRFSELLISKLDCKATPSSMSPWLVLTCL